MSRITEAKSLKRLAGATGLEPATSAVTGQRFRGTSPAFSSSDSTPRQDSSGLKHRDSTPESKQNASHPLELARLSRRAVVRVGDFEPLPAIGHRRRRRASGYKSGHSKIVLLLALMFLLAGCDRIPTCKPGDQGTYIGDAIHTGGCPKQVVNDASGNVAVRR